MGKRARNNQRHWGLRKQPQESKADFQERLRMQIAGQINADNAALYEILERDNELS